MGLFKGFEMKPWWSKFARVHEWLPSRRPTYKSKTYGYVVTLARVYEDGSVDLTRACGKIEHKSKAEFERSYLRI